MSDLVIKVCDVCDRLKGETNHWYSIFINVTAKVYFVCHMSMPEEDLPSTFYKELERVTLKKDICSIECLNKAENRVREGEKLR